MSDPRKICVVVTARPSYSRIKTALQSISTHASLELQLVVAASALLDRYGSAVDNIIDDGFELSAKVFNVLEGENPTTAAKTTGIGVLELSSVFERLDPDIVVTIADRYETMATAIAASYMNIPLAHIQGGEVTGNIDEKVRHSITKLADYHFVSSSDAYERVVKLGEHPESVFNVGCPSIDLAKDILKDPELDFSPFEKYGGVGGFPDISNGYYVVMQHPVSSEYQRSKEQITETLLATQNLDLPVLWFWPNIDAGADGTSSGIRRFREKHDDSNFHFFKNMEPHDFLRLLFNAKALIGNSSVGIRECSFMAVPVVNIGTRQHGRQRGGNVVDVGYDRASIKKGIKYISQQDFSPSKVYGNGNSGNQIAELLTTVPLSFHKTIAY